MLITAVPRLQSLSTPQQLCLNADTHSATTTTQIIHIGRMKHAQLLGPTSSSTGTAPLLSSHWQDLHRPVQPTGIAAHCRRHCRQSWPAATIQATQQSVGAAASLAPAAALPRNNLPWGPAFGSPASSSALAAAARNEEGPANGGGPHTAVLMVQCPDQKGVVASLAQLLFGFNCNILQSDQFTDEAKQPARFFQRIQFDYSDISVGLGNLGVLQKAISDCAARYNMEWTISYQGQIKKVAILVSKMDHCLYDLLIRVRAGDLNCQIPVVISNHPDLEHVAQQFGVRFVHLPIAAPRDDAAKAAQEAQIEAVADEVGANLLVLARYMQIFSKEFCDRNWQRTINIHHSFLPAFEGGRPYHRAHERGVKIIGATAHYATSELDAGPIIEQDINRITHRDSVSDMVRKGRDLERLVLARAVRWHLQDRVLIHSTANKTVVFED